MSIEVLYEEPLAIVAAADTPWSRRRKIELRELANEPWTWPESGTVIDGLVIEAFRANEIDPPRAVIHAEAYSLRLKLAGTGRFLAVVPASIMRFPGKPASLKMLAIDLPTTRRKIGIITLTNRTLSPLAQRFIEFAREAAKPFA